jgi:hypothetical protein
LKDKLQSLSFIADIPNSLESKPFASREESTGLASGPGPKLDKDHNNSLARSNWVADNTLGNKQQEALPKRVAEE